MAYPQGANFRQNLAFVTDGANEHFEAGTGVGTYPTTTAQGNTVGWEDDGLLLTLQVRDRNSGNDRRLAGMHFDTTLDNINYRFDLPSAGTYNIRAANGEANYARTCRMDLYDTSSSLGTLINGSTGAANSFLDATNTVYTAANWPGSNTAVSKTFTTTICRFRFPRSSFSETWVAHLYVESGGSASRLAYLGAG